MISKDFAIYYDLYNKYRSDYKVIEILNGKYDENVKDRAKSAKFDERLTLIGLLMDAVSSRMKNVLRNEKYTQALLDVLKGIKEKCSDKENTDGIMEILNFALIERKEMLEKEISKGLLSVKQKK